MKKALITCIALLLFQGLVTAQHSNVSVDVGFPRRFVVDDLYYSSSYGGIKRFMSDLNQDDPQLYQIMKPEFDRIKIKRNAGLAVWSTAAVTGTALVVGSITWWGEHDGIFQPGSPHYNPNHKKPNIPALIGGMGAYAVGALVGWIILPDDDDVYQFVNTFNRNSQQRKMNWEIGLNMHRWNEPGLKLTLNF